MGTPIPRKEEIVHKWYILDATDQVLGRLAVEAARILHGKHKPEFTPHLDTGDHVIVINAAQVRLTGNKLQNKFHRWHTGYPGGLKSVRYADLLKKNPERAIELAIKGMIPHNRLGRTMFRKLKVYRGSDHPHQAQLPENWPLASSKS